MNAIVRTAVAALALTGSAAYVHISATPAKPIVVKTSNMPVPMCPPDGKQACGWEKK